MYDDFEKPSARQVARGARWLIGGLIAAFLLATLVGSMSIFGWGFFQRATADFRGETAALEQVKADPAHRISAREYFFSTCASVQGFEDTIRLIEEQLLSANLDDERRGKLEGALLANRTERQRLVREYNERANNFTFEQFRDADLPEKIDPDGTNTMCSA